MPMITLTPQERDRFAAWLEQEAASYDVLATEVEKLSSSQPTVKMLRIQVFACTIVAQKLRATEEQVING